MDSYTMYIFISSRNAGGQGLPLACLLPSMVCIAVLCYVADQQPELIGMRLSTLAVLCANVTPNWLIGNPGYHTNTNLLLIPKVLTPCHTV